MLQRHIDDFCSAAGDGVHCYAPLACLASCMPTTAVSCPDGIIIECDDQYVCHRDDDSDNETRLLGSSGNARCVRVIDTLSAAEKILLSPVEILVGDRPGYVVSLPQSTTISEMTATSIAAPTGSEATTTTASISQATYIPNRCRGPLSFAVQKCRLENASLVSQLGGPTGSSTASATASPTATIRTPIQSSITTLASMSSTTTFALPSTAAAVFARDQMCEVY